MKLFYPLLLSLVFSTSCGGQVKTDLPKDSLNDPKTIPVGQPKIIKPRDVNQNDGIGGILQDKVGNLWVATMWGVYRYDGKLFTGFTTQGGPYRNVIFSISENKRGNLWFSTDSGFCRYDGKLFANYLTKEGLCTNHAWLILEAQNGDIWFVTDDGICRYNGRAFTNIPITGSSNLPSYTSPDNNPSTGIKVTRMFQEKSGKIWFGTQDRGVYYYNGTSCIHFLDNDTILTKNGRRITSILEDRNGNIWFGTGYRKGGGACSYDPTTGVLTNFKPSGDQRIMSIMEEKNGNLLFVTRHHGVCRYDGKTFTNITDKGGIKSGSVISVLEDKAGNLWFGTEVGSQDVSEDGGLWRYDGKSFTHFTTKDGLINNSVCLIFEDKDENIWVGTKNNGLCRYDGKTFTNFTE